ncbi:BTAD domain-containing putative transcriptional regulator [Kibdelosporangium aridum]|nr:BTAD domain-containing putative transcriptional regulator [Kibdelosporangium aridum]
MAEFRLLGEVEVLAGGDTANLGPARQRCVLAAMAVDVGRVVPVERLIDRVWGDDPPVRARAVLSTYTSRLRHALTALQAGRIVQRAGGYLLEAGKNAVDLHRFRELCAQARAEAGDDEQVVTTLTEGLRLWRGEALTGLHGDWVTVERNRLHEERLAAQYDLIDSQLRLGQSADLIAELTMRTANDPLDERVAGQYMLALYHSHRPADALKHYQRTRTRLVQELGVEPSDNLRQLHQRILADDPALSPPMVLGASASTRQPDPRVPRQLPADIPRFVGRDRYLVALDELSTLVTGAGHPVVITLDGAAGVGKTALAVRWAHRAGHRFPDGHLYVNLCGHVPQPPMKPADAAAALLGSIGTPADQIPSTLDGRSAMLRTALAGRQMLILLDNARHSDQIRPLLPGTGNLVLITSRNQLRSLTIREGARRVTVDTLDAEESEQLLTQSTPGSAGIDETVPQLLQLCQGLPLALAIAAERAAREPAAFPMERQYALDVLDSGDDATTDLRAVFSWSYDALSADTARMFRLIGTAPGIDISVPAAAALADVDTARARHLLDQLVATNQLHHKRPGRYQLHDLLRAYGAERSAEQDSPEQRSAAYRRLLHWLLHTAFNARPHLQASDSGLVPLPAIADIAAPAFVDQRHMLEWSAGERHNLIAGVRLAYDEGFDDLCWQLAYATWPALFLASAWHDAQDMYRLGLAAAQRCGDQTGQAHMLDGLGNAHRFDRRHLHAIEAHQQAIALFSDTNNVRGCALALSNLGASYRDVGRYEEALACCRKAYALSRECGEPGTMAISLRRIAETLTADGQPMDALPAGRQCLDLYREVGHLRGEATALQALAGVHFSTDRPETAIDHYRAAASVYRGLGDRRRQASTLTRLGECLSRTHRTGESREVRQQAMKIFEELGAP